MAIIFIIIVFAISISLYEFYQSRDSRRLSHEVAKSFNATFAKNQVSNNQHTILAGILIVTIGLVGLTIGVNRGLGGFGNNVASDPDTKYIDTFQLTLNAPPVEPVDNLPPSFSNDSRPGNGPTIQAVEEKEAKKKGTEHEEDNHNSATSSTNSSNAPTNKVVKRSTGEQGVYDLEKQLYEESGGHEAREKIRKEQEELRKQRAEKAAKRDQEAQQGQQGNQGGSSGSKGKTMVSYVLDGRTPFNNNNVNIANPGYTCGQGLSGEVVVKIKVNSNGNVISATVSNNVSNLNPCLPEQARTYALKSRFNPASFDNQEGTITYRFVP